MTSNIEQRYRFSEAPIWDIQRQYYEEQGTKAWKNNQVPQYITSNPMIAATYAEVLFGFLQDRANKGESEPIIIVELGAGAGRFAYHVLHELCQLRDYAGIALPSFRYVMTDLAMNNVLAWQQHPALQAFITEGLLDFAQYDAVQDTELHLVVSGTTIREKELQQPLVIIANYFFDSIPQELLYVGGGNIYETDVHVQGLQHSESAKPSGLLKNIQLRYEHRRASEYEQPTYPYSDVIALYREQLEDSHILFPAAGLTCLERLNRLSQSGFVLISADKGDHLLEQWRFAEPPELILHGGSFSLTANYHAIQYFFEQKGALALFPPHHYKNINVGCIFHVDAPMDYVHSRLSYRRCIERFGPDDFFNIKVWVDRHIKSMGMQELLSFWRLGGYDSEFFIQSLKQISHLLPDAADDEYEDLWMGIQKMWSSYYIMEQRYDLALDVGLILFEMGMYEQSKRFLEISVQEDQDEIISTVYYCLALCCFELEIEDEAWMYVRKLLEVEPDHEEALALMSQFESHS